MIPKIIHKIWLGESKPDKVVECDEAIKNLPPGVKVWNWNEGLLSRDGNNYAKSWYNRGVMAMVSDQLRFYLLHQYGGVYMDGDVEVLENDLWYSLEDREVLCGYADRASTRIESAVIGMAAGHPLASKAYVFYERRRKHKFVSAGNVLNTIMQDMSSVLPHDYLAPMTWEDYRECNGVVDKSRYVTENSMTFHWYMASWHGKTAKNKWQKKYDTLN